MTDEASVGRLKTLGVVGTFVWDRIVPVSEAAVEVWGGIGYSLAAASAACPEGWRVRAISRVGSDLEREALAFVGRLRGVDASGVRVVDEPNNRVELVYRDEAERTERLTGGISAWSTEALGEACAGCDALMVNFISGHETSLETAEAVFATFDGPVYADLHSLFLGVGPDGTRVPRLLGEWRRWVGCFDTVQMNVAEASLLTTGIELERRDAGEPVASPALDAGPELDPTWLEPALDAGPSLVAITLGERGSALVLRGDGGRPLVREVTLPDPRQGDPTGCGDVWGAVMCAQLLGGYDPEEAARTANRLAAAKVAHRGAEGLDRHLRRAAASTSEERGA